MSKKMIQVFAALFLAFPLTAFALEQSFTQQGLTTVVKLTPDDLVVGKKVNLAIKLETDGQAVTDRQVTLEVYEKEATEPTIKREVEILEDEYIDSWNFEKPGDYKVVVSIADPQKQLEALHYGIKATVGEVSAKGAAHEGYEEHGFFSHHFGKKGWWMGGLMLLVMVPLMIVGL